MLPWSVWAGLLLILLSNYLQKHLPPLQPRHIPVYRLLQLSRSMQALLKETGTLVHIKALASGGAPGSARAFM